MLYTYIPYTIYFNDILSILSIHQSINNIPILPIFIDIRSFFKRNFKNASFHVYRYENLNSERKQTGTKLLLGRECSQHSSWREWRTRTRRNVSRNACLSSVDMNKRDIMLLSAVVLYTVDIFIYGPGNASYRDRLCTCIDATRDAAQYPSCIRARILTIRIIYVFLGERLSIASRNSEASETSVAINVFWS